MALLLKRLNTIIERAPRTASCVLSTIDDNLIPTVDDLQSGLKSSLDAGTFVGHTPCRTCCHTPPARRIRAARFDEDTDEAATDDDGEVADGGRKKKSVKRVLFKEKNAAKEDDQGGSDSDDSNIAVKLTSASPSVTA